MPKRHRPGTTATRAVACIEEIAIATSGEDAFELVFAVAAARLVGRGRSLAARVRSLPRLLGAVLPSAGPALLDQIDALLVMNEHFEALDAIFESLVPRLGKGDKGQFFTPRPVVDFVIRALAPKGNEVVVDPACGSGAFLAHARSLAPAIRAFGCDVDRRAVRVARLLALVQGRDPESIVQGDGLHWQFPRARVVATNPPFAGRAPADGFNVANWVNTPERDVLFLERSLELLEPLGRLGIVLPYNKAAGVSFRRLRAWLFERARLFAVVGLPRETFMPHTSQRTFVLLAKKRPPRQVPSPTERTMFVVSEHAGKDAAGDATGENDLDEAFASLGPFLAAEGFSS